MAEVSEIDHPRCEAGSMPAVSERMHRMDALSGTESLTIHMVRVLYLPYSTYFSSGYSGWKDWASTPDFRVTVKAKVVVSFHPIPIPVL